MRVYVLWHIVYSTITAYTYSKICMQFEQKVGDGVSVFVLSLLFEVSNLPSSAAVRLVLSICHVTNMRSCYFQGWSLSRHVTMLPSSVAIDLLQTEI